MPVTHGIIDAKLEPLLRTFRGEFLDDATFAWRPLRDAVVSKVTIPHAKTVVMLGCDGDVFHPRVFRDLDPLARVKLDRIESRSSTLVFFGRNARRVLNPFSDPAHVPALILPAQSRIRPPVDEHPEACIAIPAHSFCTLLQRFDRHETVGLRKSTANQ